MIFEAVVPSRDTGIELNWLEAILHRFSPGLPFFFSTTQNCWRIDTARVFTGSESNDNKDLKSQEHTTM